uniref:Endonuclease/exonuclease/phosphatase domain-containing protein n=1 Tax=Amphiprion ocellaris TaxID=80972 RepID=A0A3Q1C157_AMPOC
MWTLNRDKKIRFIGKDQDGRLMITEFNYNNETYRVIHVHCPNIGGERKTFVRELNKWCVNTTNCFIIGDFNMCLSKLDRTNENKYKKDSSRTELINLMEQNNLIDKRRSLNPNNKQFSRQQKSKEFLSKHSGGN